MIQNAAKRDIKMEILGERLRIVADRIKIYNTFLLDFRKKTKRELGQRQYLKR